MIQVCYGCQAGLEPAQLFAQSNPQSIYNIFDSTYGATNAATMLNSRGSVNDAETQALVPIGGAQRWEDTWVASFPAAFPAEPSFVQVDREGGALGSATSLWLPNLSEYSTWRNWIASRPQLWDAAADGLTEPVYMRAWGSESINGTPYVAQYGFIAPMTPLDAADCPPGMASCTWGDLWAYRWSLTTAIDGGYGLQLADFSNDLPFNDGATNQHGFNPRVIAAFAAKYGYTIPGSTVAQQAAWIVANHFNDWNDFYSQGYGNYFAAMASRIGAATGQGALIIDGFNLSPMALRGEATDPRIVLTKISPKNFLVQWDEQTIQEARRGPIVVPIMTELVEALGAAYEPLTRNALIEEADDAAYWNSIVAFYPTLTGGGTQTVDGVSVSGDQVELGYKLMKRLWLQTSWAHIVDRSGNVRRANAWAMRDYWDVGALTASQLGPLQSLIQGVVPTHPFGPAFYYSSTAMRAAEAYFGQTQSTYSLCGGNFVSCTNELNSLEAFLDSGGVGNYYVSDAALSQMAAGSSPAPSAWIVPHDLFLAPYTRDGSSTPDAVASMSTSEQQQLTAIAPIVTSVAELQALPTQPLLISTTGGSVAPSASCKGMGFTQGNPDITGTALSGFGFYDQAGRLIVVVSNPSPCPDAVSLSGVIQLKGLSLAGAPPTGSYTQTDLFAGTTSSLSVSSQGASIAVTVARWDTMAFAISYP